jgi:hypothetical protein
MSNVRLSKTNQPNFCAHQGYFFTFDYAQDNLLQKTDDGNTAFSYPFDVLLSTVVSDSQFDGVYFWSLENPVGNNCYIKKWKIENYVCKQQQVFSFIGDASHSYSVNTFSVEHYHTTLVGATSSGATTLNLAKYAEDDVMNFVTTSGVNLTLHLGPNSNAEEEDVIVSTVVSGVVTIVGSTQYEYANSDPVNFFTYLWLFNNYDGTSSATGALYKFDAYTGDYITRYASGAYKDVTASTFYNVDSFAEYGDVDTLCYIKGTNTLFVNTSDAGVKLPYYGSMVMNNILSDTATVIPVYGLTMDDQNVFRLQNASDGASSLTEWGNYYNYVLSTLDSFVTSISMTAHPATIAANGVFTTDVTALVKDQFLQPIVARLVNFTDDDPVGIIIGSPANTDAEGEAKVQYRAGTSARSVKITAVVEQT